MSLVKRFELWVLLILIGGGLWYIFQVAEVEQGRGRGPIAAGNPEPANQVEAVPRFSLQQTTVTRDGDHFLVEIQIHCRNDQNQTLTLAAPGTRLLAAGGREVPAFFLPFQAPAEIPALGEKVVTLRYWLSHDEINGPVSLGIDKDTIPIKVGGFKTDKLADKQSRSFHGPQWNSEPD